MTPKANSTAIVPTAPREVISASKGGHNGKATEKDSTIRALVLRNGKYGARGTGEIVLMSRMTGREKLDLLAGMSSSECLIDFISVSLFIKRILLRSPDKQ